MSHFQANGFRLLANMNEESININNANNRKQWDNKFSNDEEESGDDLKSEGDFCSDKQVDSVCLSSLFVLLK